MKKITTLIKCMSFWIIAIIIFQILTYIFVPKWMSDTDPATPRIKGFYQEEKNTIDVFVVGASDIGRGYSPIEVWKEYGVTSYNLGTSNQTMSLGYYILKEAMQYQKIQVVVLDMDTSFVIRPAPEGECRKMFDNMKNSRVKLEALSDEKLELDNKLSYIFPLLRFHSRWNELENIDFKFDMEDEYHAISYKGMAMNTGIVPYIDKKDYMGDKGAKVTIPEENVYYIDKIVKLCNENNIKILWTELPSSTSWSLARHNAIMDLAHKYDIEFIDYNLSDIQNELGFDWKIHTADKGNHLNVNGAEIISNHIGKILSEKYNCKSRKDDQRIKSNWDAETTRYNENKKILEQNN